MVLYHQGSSVYTSINSADVRNLFTVVFFFLIACITGLGGFFLKNRNRARLLRGKPEDVTIPMNQLTTWLSEADTVRYFYKTHRLPGGFYALLMITAGAFHLMSHLFVGRYITSSQVQGSCLFDDSFYLNNRIVAKVPFTGNIIPAAQWPAAIVAFNAQYYSQANGGFVGIYRKSVNSPFFSAQQEDTAGQWSCSDQDADRTYTADSTLGGMIADLQDSGILYAAASAYTYSTRINDTDLRGALVWTASATPDSQQPWDVKASITVIDIEGQPMTWSSFQCTMQAPEVEWVLSVMPSKDTLQEWVERAYGLSLTGDVDTWPYLLETALNAMVMVGAGANDVQVTSVDAVGSDLFYGCLVQRTKIQIEIFVALITLLSIFIPLIVADVCYLCTSFGHMHRSKVSNIPSDLVSWQVGALREAFKDRNIHAKDVSQYCFGWILVNGVEEVGYRRKGVSSTPMNLGGWGSREAAHAEPTYQAVPGYPPPANMPPKSPITTGIRKLSSYL